jgi:hypothetical protein
VAAAVGAVAVAGGVEVAVGVVSVMAGISCPGKGSAAGIPPREISGIRVFGIPLFPGISALQPSTLRTLGEVKAFPREYLDQFIATISLDTRGNRLGAVGDSPPSILRHFRGFMTRKTWPPGAAEVFWKRNRPKKPRINTRRP